jgi:hypothetical protein
MKASLAHGSQSSSGHAPAKSTTTFTFPHLHQDVLEAAPELSPAPQFKGNNTKICEEEWKTFVMASFSCKAHGRTPATWSSKKVSIVIQLHQGNRYSAVVYGQRCDSCKRLGIMKLDETSYVERVANRLKRWAGIETEAPIYPTKMTPPHREDLCEGCKAGVCKGGVRSYRDF